MVGRRDRVRNRAFSPLVLLLAAAAWAVPALASAQVGGSRLHLGAGFALDFAGEAEVNDSTPDPELDPTVGLRGHLDYAIHRYVSLGGLARMSWWQMDDYDYDRSFLLDLGPRVIGHYEYRDFRFYAGISPGLTLSVLNDDFRGIDNPAAGFTMSVTVAGMEWWFARHVGLFVELGWVGHWFEHEYENDTDEVDVDLSQGLFEFGFVFGV